jgi:septum formation topological specificity factor MinE
MGCKHCQPQVVVNKVVSKTDTVVNKPESMEEEIMKILDKHFPDEMDSSMLHPNLPEAVVKLSALFSGKLKRQREELRERVELVFAGTSGLGEVRDQVLQALDENHA